MEKDRIKTAFVGFGEINSPRELIENMCLKARMEVESLGVKVVTTGPVSDDPGERDVRRAINDLKKEEFDSLIICLAGWIPSHAVISITEEFRNLPIILWGLAGEMKNGRVVTPAPQAGTAALRRVFEDLKYHFCYVYNIIGKPSPLEKISNFLVAATAVKNLRNKRIGMMGFRDMKLYNTLYEGVSLKSRTGIEIDFFEMLEMLCLSEKTEEAEIRNFLGKIKTNWDFEKEVDERFLRKGISYFLAIKQIAEAKGFSAISLKDVEGMKKILNFPPAMIFMLLSDELNVCTIPENDAMGAVTQLIIKELTGQCAAYLEFYEFFENSVLLGVPDFVPAEVADGKVKVTAAAFGGIPGGLLNISTLKTGKVTLARLSNSGSEYMMHLCTGEGKLRAWEEAGWDSPAPQLPSLEIFLDKPVDEFAQNISGQHYIIAYGDHSDMIKNYCYLTDMRVV